jgi:hypothetical protein
MVLPIPDESRLAKKKEDAPVANPPVPISAPAVSDPNPDDPSIRYLDAGYGDEGTCPVCMGDGVVGRFCFGCCDKAGMMVGRCPRCEEVGRLGDDCPECPTRTFETQLEMGVFHLWRGGAPSTLSAKFVRINHPFTSRSFATKDPELASLFVTTSPTYSQGGEVFLEHLCLEFPLRTV